MSFLRGLANVIGFKLESTELSTEKKDDEVGNKKNKLKVGNFVTNAQGTMIGRIVEIRPAYDLSIGMNRIYSRSLKDVGKMEYCKPATVKRISKKQAKKIKKAIDKLQETNFEYGDKKPIFIGDIVKYDKGYTGSLLSTGVIVDTDDSNLPIQIKVIESGGFAKDRSSFLAWIKPEEILEKIGRYNIKAEAKGATQASLGFSYTAPEKFRVGIPNVYGEGQFPEVTKEFLDGIRGPDPEPAAVVSKAGSVGHGAGGNGINGTYAEWDAEDEAYYEDWLARQTGLPI